MQEQQGKSELRVKRSGGGMQGVSRAEFDVQCAGIARRREFSPLARYHQSEAGPDFKQRNHPQRQVQS